MVGTIKTALKRCALQNMFEWHCLLWKCIFGYRGDSCVGDSSPYNVMFRSLFCFLNRTKSLVGVEDHCAVHHVERAAANVIHAQRMIPGANPSSLVCIAVGDQVLMVRGELFACNRWLAFISRFSGPYTVNSVNHSHCVLISSPRKQLVKEFTAVGCGYLSIDYKLAVVCVTW